MSAPVATLLDRVSDGIVVLDREWRYLFINPAGAAMFGRRPEQLLGKHIWTEFPEGVGQPFHQAYERAMATQQPIVLEDYYAPWDRWFENRIYPSSDALTILYHEITDRKRAELAVRRERDVQAAQARVLATMARGAPLAETLEELVQALEELSPGVLASVLLLDADGVHVRHGAAPSLPRDYVRAIDGQAIGPAAGSCGTAMYSKAAVVVEDILTDPRWDSYRAATAPHGLRSCWSTPIFGDGGEVLGSFALYTRQPALPTDEHCRIIELATHLASVAIQRHRDDAAFRVAAERLRLAVEATNTGLWDWDLRTNRVRFSKEWKRQIGYDEHEISDEFEEWRSRVHPDDRAAAVARVEAFLAAPYAGFESEFRIQHRDGSWRCILARGDLVRGPDGAPARMIGIHVDLTERRLAEQRLRDSETQLRQILDGMFTFVGLLSLDGIVLEVNRAPLEAAGLRREDLIGQPVAESYWWSYAPEPQARVRDAVSRAGRGEVVRFDQVVRIGEAQFLTIDVTFAPLRDAAGTVTGVVASAADITDRKAVETALRISEERHRLFAMLTSDYVYVFRVEADGRRELEWISDSIARVGHTLEEHRGLPAGAVIEDDQPAALANWLRVLAGESTVIEVRVRDRQGSIRWVRNYSQPVWDETRTRVIKVYGAAQDITQQKRADLALRDSLEQLRRLAAAQERTREAERARVARELHDELGQALTGLKMDLAWLRARLPDQAAVRERMDEMARLLDETVAFGRRVAGELRPGVLDDLGLAPALRWLAREFAQRSGLAVDADTPDAVELEPERATAVFRIVQEALTNVARHAGATRVHLRLSVKAGMLDVAVQDDGRGIAGGAGEHGTLGVIGMRERAEAWGGVLTLEPAPGGGTLVAMRMPLAVAEAEP